MRCWLSIVPLALCLIGCPDSTKVASECVAADLVGQCPVGSSPVLGASAESACGGSFELKVITEEGAATGQCSSNGSCEFLCQYASPCTCGVVTLSKESITCAECPDQSCGDGRCEGTERATCEPGDSSCFACLEDCGGATCGDGDCTGDESPLTCPQDCENLCTPSSKTCVGTEAHVCAADGASKDVFDCASVGLICGGGECVMPGACGNGACEAGEDAVSCPEDCGSLCVPSSAACQGDTLVTCSADGTTTTEVDCAEDDRVCDDGECKLADVCGNGICEAGESESCPVDCTSVCGNQECENGEENSCPQDCTVCGDRICGAAELESCPQDCGVCIPSERFCLGKILRVCNANGSAFEDVDCTAFDQSCAGGNCIEPGVCGNGACEAGEDLDTCARDCTVICGDGDCEAGETFTTCSADCDPQCGDGSCQGDEVYQSCALDCVESCGNGTCDALEERDTCPKDCGFCGNGVCEDGAESASQFPAEPLITCLEDCVVSGCQSAGECDDGIFCTTGACSDGVCHYTASDDLCPLDEKCIKFAGCCPDADRDGFADVACGGSDCDDDDPLVHPGAIEPCGGGDRNCNGVHRPALKAAKKVTDSAAFKSGLSMAWDGTRYWAAWRAVPEAVAQVDYARISRDGSVIEASGTVPNSEPKATKVNVAWSPRSSRLGLAWDVVDPDGGKGFAAFTTISESGVLSSEPPALLESIQRGNYPYSAPEITGMVWLDGVWIMSDAAWYNTGGVNVRLPYGWWGITETGELTRAFPAPCPGICNGATLDLMATDTQVIGRHDPNRRYHTLDNRSLFKVVPNDVTGTVTKVDLVPEAAAGACALGWDGETTVLVCKHLNTVSYHRIAANGAALTSSTLFDTDMIPVAIASAPGGLAAGDTAKVGVLGTEGANLVFLVRDLDGSEVVEPGAVGGGSAISAPHLFWDGDAFAAWWLAKSGDIEQVFTAAISCE